MTPIDNLVVWVKHIWYAIERTLTNIFADDGRRHASDYKGIELDDRKL